MPKPIPRQDELAIRNAGEPGADRLAAWSTGNAAAGGEIPLNAYWHLANRYRWQIITFVLVITAVATLIALVLPKQYQSTAILRIDPASQNVASMGGSSRSNIPLSALRLLTTESQVLMSPAVVMKTIRTQDLAATREFGGRLAGKSLLAMSEAQLNHVLKKVTSRISVSQPRDTYLLLVSFRSVNPGRAAQVANSLLQSLIEHDANTRVQALMGTSKSMRMQLVDLRSHMERSQAALVHYENKYDVLNPDSKDNIMLARLSQVNQELDTAQNHLIQIQSQNALAKSGNLDALIATEHNEYLLSLTKRVQQDQRSLRQMAQVYGPKFPIYREQAALLRHDRALLSAQERHAADQLHSRYQMAAVRVHLLRQELARQKLAMDRFNLKAIPYSTLRAAAQNYTKLYYQLLQRIQEAAVSANLHSETLRVISPALVEQVPVFPRPFRTAVIAFLVSLVLALGFVLLRGALDNSITSAEQIELWFNLPVLATLPKVPLRDLSKISPLTPAIKLLHPHASEEEPAPRNTKTAYHEAVSTLQSALLLAKNQDLQTLALTSSVPSEGKSTITANLAVAFANMGKRTILIDTDMRKPSQHRLFNCPNRRGLSSVLRGQAHFEQLNLEIPGIPNLSLLPAGSNPANPSELLHLGLPDLLDQLRARFDQIIFDCPPVLGFSDIASIANQADGCLLVVHAGETERQMVSGSLRQLQAVQARMLGIILNFVSESLGSYYTYYNYYRKYSDTETAEEQA